MDNTEIAIVALGLIPLLLTLYALFRLSQDSYPEKARETHQRKRRSTVTTSF